MNGLSFFLSYNFAILYERYFLLGENWLRSWEIFLFYLGKWRSYMNFIRQRWWWRYNLSIFMVIRLILVILVVYLKFAKFFILCGNFLVSFTSFFYKIIYPQEGLIAKFSRNYWREHHFKYKIRKKIDSFMVDRTRILMDLPFHVDLFYVLTMLTLHKTWLWLFEYFLGYNFYMEPNTM